MMAEGLVTGNEPAHILKNLVSHWWRNAPSSQEAKPADKAREKGRRFLKHRKAARKKRTVGKMPSRAPFEYSSIKA